MEEIVTTDAIQKEILDDARRKAEKTLREADEEIAAAKLSGEALKTRALAEITKAKEARVARYRAESQARIPLEKTRLKTEYIDRRLREALAVFMNALDEERVAALAARPLKESAALLDSAELRLRYRGLGRERVAAVASAALPGARIGSISEDPSLPGRGIVAEAADGSVRARATMDLVEESLLSRYRGELARALCAEAIRL